MTTSVAVGLGSQALPALAVGSLVGIAVAAVASLAVVAGIVVYLIRNSPETFTTFRKLQPDVEKRDDDLDG